MGERRKGCHFDHVESGGKEVEAQTDQGLQPAPYSNVSRSASAEEEDGSRENPQKSGRVAATLSREYNGMEGSSEAKMACAS